jgi:hypothetical protein
LRAGRWRNHSFEHWLVISLIIAACSEAAFASQSTQPHDAMFAQHDLLGFSRAGKTRANHVALAGYGRRRLGPNCARVDQHRGDSGVCIVDQQGEPGGGKSQCHWTPHVTNTNETDSGVPSGQVICHE